ncbi:MAG: hypothetical protein WCO89_14360, partial [Syntrophus sp. (in: bacteria)]
MLSFVFLGIGVTIFFTLLLPEVRLYFFNVGGRWLYILLFSFTLSLLMTPLMRWLARRFNIFDIPEERKVHERATPLLGGVAIIIAFTASLLSNMVLDREIILTLYAG